MKAKDKALELVNNFYLNGIKDKDYSMEYEDSKECALICVDEILNNRGIPFYFESCFKFWKEVKQEINKL